MATNNGHNGWALAAAGLGVGVLLGLALAPRDAAPVNPALRTLDANLWVQTSPEYRALCLQAYRLAGERLRQKLADRKGDRPAAVILDLDETVFDNSPFQTWLYKNATTFSDERWQPWEREKGKEVLAVPGAVEFIAEAEKAGVTVFYISNRTEAALKGAVEALEHLGINAKDAEKRVLLRGKTGDKTERREQVAKDHDVLLLIGDTLTDFDQQFATPKFDANDAAARRKIIADRKALVDKNRERWGDRWIVLPNPSYGDHTRLGGADPLEVMSPSTLPGR